MKTNLRDIAPGTEIPLAIVGLDIIAGKWDGPSAFEYAIYQGQSQTSLAPSLIAGLQKPETLPQADWDRFTLEDRLTLTGCMRALGSLGRSLDHTCAVILSQGSRLAAETISRRAGVPNPARNSPQPDTHIQDFLGKITARVTDDSLQGNLIAAALDEAQAMLASGRAELVVIAAASLLSDFRLLIDAEPTKYHPGENRFGFESSINGWSAGEGAVAIVVAQRDWAIQHGKPIYALIDSLGYAGRTVAQVKVQHLPTFVSSEPIAQSCLKAFELTRITSCQVGYLETLASGFTPLDTAEIGGLAQAYRHEKSDLSAALNSAGANAGYLFTAASLAALLKAALCLSNRIIPPVTGWSQPKKNELWENTPFYVATEPRTWFQPHAAGSRYAAVNSIGWDGSCAHIILREETSQPARSSPIRSLSTARLYLASAASPDELAAELLWLRNTVENSETPTQAAQAAFSRHQSKAGARFTASLTALDREEILREVNLAIRDVPAAIEKNKAWQTPSGSFFTPTPLGAGAPIAFVYPGAFNSYIGLGRDLLSLFPQLHDQLTQITADLGTTIQERLLYPRGLNAFSREETEELENKLTADPIALITSGSLLAVLYTQILRTVFKIQPSAAMGYSLGEIGMLFASGIWGQADAVRAGLQDSPLFKERIAGPQNAVREAWGLQPVNSARDSIWANYFLMTPAENVLRAIEQEPRVYLTHINTPRQVVIGGEPQACQRVIAALKCNSLRAPFDFALHCDAMRSEYSILADMLRWPVASEPGLRLYSAADFEPLEMNSQQIAHKIARMLCSSLDFPALVRKVHNDGIKIFIELGANANCTKWIDDTLKEQPNLAIAINRKGVDDHTSLVRMLAKLAAHQVSMDLSPLYNGSL